MGKKKEVDDRFKKFGTVSFTSISKINDFIDYLEKGKIMGSECKKCGRVFFPPRADCHECLSSDMGWFEVEGAGKLETYSKLKYAPAGFKDDAPYTIAVIAYGKHKIFGRISDAVPEDEIKIGMKMKTVSNTLSNGQINFIFEKE